MKMTFAKDFSWMKMTSATRSIYTLTDLRYLSVALICTFAAKRLYPKKKKKIAAKRND